MKEKQKSIIKDRAGQAMAEYAIITAALLGGLIVMSYSVFSSFVNALQLYLDGFYIVLNLPIP